MSTQQKLTIFLSRIRTSSHAVLQYDSDIDALSVWKWPLTAQGERVTPSDLRDHRLSNRFLGPCCVCPIIAEGQPAFTEAAIFVVLSGRFAGEYVTECAQNRCGYFVEVLLERIHSKVGVPVKVYPSRDPGEPRPPPVLHISERLAAATRPRPLKRTYAQITVDDASFPATPSPARPIVWLDRFLQLNASIRPGLTEADFQALFIKCTCGLIMTRSAAKAHYCVREQTASEVIDLTDIVE